MLRKRTWILLLLVVGLRLLLQGWDSHAASSTPHPDERQVGFVSEKFEGWFDDPGFYAYGSLHFQGVRGVAAVLGMGSQLRGLIVGGRALSVAASLAAILLGWIVARRAWGRRTGDLFLLLAAFIPLDLQQSHFATVEAHHAAWVMAALAASFWLASGGRGLAAATAGIAVGASLAVKVSSLALGLPLAVAVLAAGRRRDGGFVLESANLGSVAALAAAIAFWLSQPWAFATGRPPFAVFIALAVAAVTFHLAGSTEGGRRMAFIAAGLASTGLALLQVGGLLSVNGPVAWTLFGSRLNPAYLHGVGEQVDMVMGRADLPYVRVYHDTLPVLYSLRELAFWGFGVALVAAAVAGVVAAARRLTRRWRHVLDGRLTASSALLVVLLAWLIPMALRLSTLQVKFLRYWEPLVVPATLIAAWWLMRLNRRARRIAVTAVVAGTVVWGLAYLWAFVDPHPHLTAARWLSPLLDTGQVVAFEHWDEALDLVADDGAVERIGLPSYDLPDDHEKALRWAGELARADWVVLTSNRVRRTVLTNPERFPQTGRLYRLLLAGEAGFEPVARIDRGPRILGLEWPVQSADESFLNYDFPRVVVLRRAAEVSPEKLAERVSRPLPYLDELDANGVERQLVEPLPAVTAVPSRPRQLIDLMLWVLIFAAAGMAIWVLLLPTLHSWPDAGAGLALVSGWFAPAWIMWLGSELRLWPVGKPTASWIFLALLAAGGAACAVRRREVLGILRRRRPAIIRVLTITAAVFVLFLVVRVFNPAIFWGEKPMDFTFLNAFLRTSSWPPGEPWMAGMPLHYYYFGEVLAAFPILVSGCTAGVGYNLAAAAIPALGAAVLAAFGLLIARRRSWAAAGLLPLLVLLTGNLAWPWLLNLWRAGRIFDAWWATSRVIPGFAIDEYPLWTALFADLHGHFIALPVLLAALAWGWTCVTLPDRRWWTAAALCGVATAALVATNPWDIFIFVSVLAVGTVVAARRPVVGIGRLAAAAALSFAAAAPFIVELMEGLGAGAGGRGLFLTDADFAPAWAVLRHFGPFVVPLAVLAVAILGRRCWLAVPAAGVGIVAGLSFSSSAAALALAATALFALAAVRTPDRLGRMGWSLAVLGTVAVAGCERFTLIDRMNTLFKIYNGVWVVLAAALAIALLRTRGRRRLVLVAVWAPLQLAAFVNLPLGIAQGWLQPRIASPRPTLDGQAFLAAQDPQSWFLARALQAARPGVAIAEAAGISYSDFTRIAMHTGQPTVLGWEWHLQQRGQAPAEIAARMADLETLYAGADPVARRAVLDRYRVGWVVVGDVERRRYGLDAPDPLTGVPGVRLLAEHEGALLYRVDPTPSATVEVVTPAFELPVGMDIVGRVPRRERALLRSLAIDASGATVVLRDGEILDLDLAASDTVVLKAPPCSPTSVARRRSERWASCVDGTLYVFQDGTWNAAGKLPEAGHVVGGDAVWAWGTGGLWRLQEAEHWQRVHRGEVTAAAAVGPGIAWSDGAGVWVGTGDAARQVGVPLTGVRGLAVQSSTLWALDENGLYRSGGSMLPWRQVFGDGDALAALGGGAGRLWLVFADGLIAESQREACASPWQAAGAGPSEGLDEPRGLAVSPAGWFVVADTQNNRLRWYTTQGVCLDEVGGEGAGVESYREPSGLALAADGSLAVADTWNGRVKIIRPDGTLEVFGEDLYGPRGVLWEPDGSLLVADTGNRRVLRYRAPQWTVETVAELGAPVVGLAWTSGLLAAAVPADGAVYLLDPNSGVVVRRLEVPGWIGRGQQEGYLAVLPSGELAASAPEPGEVWLVDPAGTDAARLERDGLPGITGIALLPDGQLLASLTWEDRLVRIPIEQ